MSVQVAIRDSLLDKAFAVRQGVRHCLVRREVDAGVRVTVCMVTSSGRGKRIA